MALSSSYVLRESAANLRRNLFMTIAAILTMAVSLTALGAVLVMRQAIAKAAVQSQGGVEMAIFLLPKDCASTASDPAPAGSSSAAPASSPAAGAGQAPAAGSGQAGQAPAGQAPATGAGAGQAPAGPTTTTTAAGDGQPCLSQQETNALKLELSSTPGVKSFYFVDKAAAYKEFAKIFSGPANQAIVSSLTQADMPPSFRVVPTNPNDIAELGKQFEGQPGVDRVSYPAQEIHNLLQTFHRWRLWGFVLSIGVLIGAVALIVNTIQLAIFARRREVAVMKLVGATNWFIRVPFMLEGLIHGLAGSAVAFIIVYFTRNGIAGFLPQESLIFGSSQLYVSPHEAILTGLLLVVGGAVVGVLGSAFAVARYLAV